MKLQLEYNNMSSEDINLIINLIRHQVIRNLNLNQLSIVENYINNHKIFYNRFTKYINLSDVLQVALKHLTYKIDDKLITFQINPNAKMYNADATIYDICKYLEYGALENKGLYIFTKAFNYVRDNLELLGV